MDLIPKGEGAGIIIPVFVYREFVHVFPLTDEDFVKVNKSREGKKYSDKEAARNNIGNTKN